MMGGLQKDAFQLPQIRINHPSDCTGTIHARKFARHVDLAAARSTLG
jgi:hypothetical protein